MIIEIICIAVICVVITDQLHFWDEFSPYIKSWMTGGRMKSPIDFKLFRCSTCQTHWLCLIYLLCTGNFTILNYTVILILAWLTPVVNDILTLVIMTIKNILGKLDI